MQPMAHVSSQLRPSSRMDRKSGVGSGTPEARLRAVTCPSASVRSILTAFVALAALTALVSACSVAPASGSLAADAPGASPTPTLNPNQLERLRRSAGVSPTPIHSTQVPTPAGGGPAASPEPRPTPSPYAPDLEAMLPSSLGGIPLQRYSTPAGVFDVGGDICSLLCPGEPSRLAQQAAVPVEALTVAVAYPQQGSPVRVAVIAIRFQGLDPKRSPVDIRIKAGGHVTSPEVDGLVAHATPFKVGSRTITWVTWPVFYQPDQGEYLLSSGNVLFIVAGLPPETDGKVPDDVRSMVEALR